VVLCNGNIKGLLIIYESEVALEYAVSICFDGFVTAIFLLVLLMAPILLCCNKTIQKQVLFIGEDNSTEEDRKETLMILALMVFVTTIVTSALWYGLRYDSGSTYKPEWTNRLG
jgi:Mn2+/Fe2+ NRAMP family transporter